jgi:hypothetical protein
LPIYDGKSAILLQASFFSTLEKIKSNGSEENRTEEAMKKFMIEREIPKVGTLQGENARQAAEKSNSVLNQLGPDIQWVQSYVAADKMFCVYLAKDEALVHQHAQLSGFPASKVTEIGKVFDPTTANCGSR